MRNDPFRKILLLIRSSAKKHENLAAKVSKNNSILYKHESECPLNRDKGIENLLGIRVCFTYSTLAHTFTISLEISALFK